MGATALARSLRLTKTKADIVVLHTGGVGRSALNPLQQLNCRLISRSSTCRCPTPSTSAMPAATCILQPLSPRGRKPDFHSPLDNFCKLRLWELTEYERCVFIDADAIVLSNIDKLFAYPEFSAAPNVYETLADFHRMNSGVFVARPSADTFRQMLTRLDQPEIFWKRTDQTFPAGVFPRLARPACLFQHAAVRMVHHAGSLGLEEHFGPALPI
jgi:alpha-N-acetylglucosamine transferase